MEKATTWTGWSVDGRVPHAGASDATSRTQRLLTLTIWFVPLNWILGTSLFWFYGVALACAGSMRRPSGPEYALLGLSAALVLGLVASGERAVDRMMGSLYNLSLIIALIVVMNAARHLARSGPDRLRPLWTAAVGFSASQLLWTFAVWAAVTRTGTMEAEVRTLILGALGTLPGALAEYSRAVIVVTDWTSSGSGPRVHGMGLYATEGALLIAISGLLAAIRLAATRRPILLVAAVEAATVVALVVTASRTTLLGYVVSAVLLAGLVGRRALVGGLVALPLVLLAAGAAVHYGPDALSEFFSALNSSRAGSSDSRLLSYTLAIDMVMQQNPLTGLGIKPRDPSLIDVPIGSHSSFVSMFTKGGFLALALFASFYAIVIARMVAVQGRLLVAGPADPIRDRRVTLIYLSRAVFVILTWWTTEDFDAPAHAALLSAICIGTFWGLSDTARTGTRLSWGGGTAAGARALPGTAGEAGGPRAAVPPRHRPVPDAG